MDRFSLEERWEILQFYFESKGSLAETVRKCRTKFGRNKAPTASGVKKFVKKVRESGMLVDNTSYPRVRPVRSAENIAAVAESVRVDPGTSTRHRAQELNISRTSLRRILHKDLGMFAYKVQLTQELKRTDHELRYNFAVWAQMQLEQDADYARKIIFSDEAHFHLNGYVNKQNCRIWGTENPHCIEQSPLHPKKVTVWCGFWSDGIIGPYFFEDERGNRVTVNGERYRSMITEFLWPEIDDLDLDDVWFQQDGATCHTAGLTIDLLRERFGNRVISRQGDVNWPPRSCDLTPLDFFLWGTVKDKCYVDKPQTIDALKANITRAIHGIEQEVIDRVLGNWVDRMDYIRRSRGSHLNEILFHN